MILEHFDELEADFLRFYAADLPAAIWGPAPMSARKIAVLVKGLPPDSAIARALNPSLGWGTTEELLAVLTEQVDLSNRLFLKAHSREGSGDPKPFITIRRPWQDDTDSKPKMSDPADVARFLGRGYDPTRGGEG